MTGGRIVAVVGASGSGKDSLMEAAKALLPEAEFMRRLITRPAGNDVERHTPATEKQFERELADGSLLFHWKAHGCRYGIPVKAAELANNGRLVVFNGSRHALPRMLEAWPGLGVVWVDVPERTRLTRLRRRGRESAESIEARMQRREPDPLPEAVRIKNDGTLAQGARRLAEAVRTLAASVSPEAESGGGSGTSHRPLRRRA